MYVTQIEIENLRAIEKLRWAIDAKDAPGWHVILGENGAGKSTFLRAAALGLLGSDDIAALRVFGEDWLRQRTTEGNVEVEHTRAAHVVRAMPGKVFQSRGAVLLVVAALTVGAVAAAMSDSVVQA